MNNQEQKIRRKLGIPDTATRILIFEASAHLDWDWMTTFLGYYNNGYINSGYEPVKDTFNKAIGFMQDNQNSSSTYYYAICEMAYLRQYLSDFPDQIPVLKGLADQLSISGGGITSAENLLTHGEAFIRNYLIGRQWLSDTLGILDVPQLWIPDDFGSDGQLPIVVRGMGYQGVSFWRAPIAGKFNGATPTAQTPSQILTNNGLDFIWKANDQSEVFAHWLSLGYCGGNNLLGYGATSLNWSDTLEDSITNTFVQNVELSPTPYSFIPIDCDFNTPYDDLLEIIADWNVCNGWPGSGNGCPGQTIPPSLSGGYVVAATYADFVALVTAHNQGNGGQELNTLNLLPNPYYAGCYAMYPDLKQMHYAATRALLQAESLEVLLEYLALQDAATWESVAADARGGLANAWNELMPSTHHDYITGTAPARIYTEEQQADLQTAQKDAESALSYILSNIVGAIPPLDTSENSVVLFNGTGVPQGGPVTIAPPAGGWQSVSVDGVNLPLQSTEEGDLLMVIDDGSVPSYGYITVGLSLDSPTVVPSLSATYDSADNTYMLANSSLQVTIGTGGITSLIDLGLNGGTELLGGTGNEVVFYEDGGNNYRFGNEIPYTEASTCVAFKMQPFNLQNESIQLTEDGPLRKTVQVSGYYEVNSKQMEFTMTYSLVAGDPYLRISTTGTAPAGYSVMVSFTFLQPTMELTHGTAYHWETDAPRQYWTTDHDCSAVQEQMTFEATHNFVITLDGGGEGQAAIYHESTPAWAIANGSVLGCILRSVPFGHAYNPVSDTDSAQYTANYALRVVSGLGVPTMGGQVGGPLREALQFNNPLTGVPIPNDPQQSVHLPNTMSIASSSGETPIITALKAGTFNQTDLILRVYQPTNTPCDVVINIDSSIAEAFQNDGQIQAVEVTALELPVAMPIILDKGSDTISFTAPYALTTIALSR